MSKIKIKKNDTVLVKTGNSKGSRGKVIRVYPKLNRALVEGVNMVSKHTKPNAENPQGGIIKKEATIHISNLVLVDPKTGEPTKLVEKKIKRVEK